VPVEAVPERYGLGDDPARRFVLGAFDPEGRLVGVAGCARERGAKVEHRAGLWGMFVAPEWQRRGAGRTLVGATVEEAKRWPGLEQITLQVVTSRPEARALYASCGFESFGLARRAYRHEGRYWDVEHMVLHLVAP
jgi:RimJ/RimL family protein N-acetyltransferase